MQFGQRLRQECLSSIRRLSAPVRQLEAFRILHRAVRLRHRTLATPPPCPWPGPADAHPTAGMPDLRCTWPGIQKSRLINPDEVPEFPSGPLFTRQRQVSQNVIPHTINPTHSERPIRETPWEHRTGACAVCNSQTRSAHPLAPVGRPAERYDPSCAGLGIRYYPDRGSRGKPGT